jgi:hypothetical protein
VVIFFIAVMCSLLDPGGDAAPAKFSQTAALYCLFRLRRMEMKGGRYGGLENGAACVDRWLHTTFRLQVPVKQITLPPSSRCAFDPHPPPPPLSLSLLSFQVVSLLMDCVEPVEIKFKKTFELLEEDDPSHFLKLRSTVSFNSSVGAPLSQRALVEDGGALAWWTILVKEVDHFSEMMKINPKHKGPCVQKSQQCFTNVKSKHLSFQIKGFKMMVAAAKKKDLKFEDVYGKGADSPDGTWKGITVVHTYEFVFLCFMNAFAKKVRQVLRPPNYVW